MACRSIGVVAVAWVLVVAAPAAAQRFEAGGMAGVACQGSEGSACGGGSGLGLFGGYGSVWLTEQLEAQVRVTRFGLDELRHSFEVSGATPPMTVTVVTSNRSRTLLNGQLLYHFGRGPLRPSVGVGVGRRRDRQRVACTTADCESVPAPLRGGAPLGAQTLSGPNLPLSLGLHARLGARLVARVGLTHHNLVGDYLASTEWWAGIGLRL